LLSSFYKAIEDKGREIYLSTCKKFDKS